MAGNPEIHGKLVGELSKPNGCGVTVSILVWKILHVVKIVNHEGVMIGFVVGASGKIGE